MSENSIPEAFYEAYPEPAVKENLTRIWEQVKKTWGTAEGMQYLESLLVVEDDRSREGFTPEIISELLLLGKLHEEAFPQFEVVKLGGEFEFGDDSSR